MTDTITILMTAAGAPQTPTLIRHLRANGDAPVRLVALDMNPEVAGRFLADAFHVIPEAGAEGYRERIFEILDKERPDAFLNVSGNDVPHIARMKNEIEAMGVRVLCSDAEHIDLVNDKYRLFETFRDDPDVPVPEYAWPRTLDEFVETARAMGYPKRDSCFRPHVSKFSRVFRRLS